MSLLCHSCNTGNCDRCPQPTIVDGFGDFSGSIVTCCCQAPIMEVPEGGDNGREESRIPW